MENGKWKIRNGAILRYSAVLLFIFHFSFSIFATEPSPLEFLEAMSRAGLKNNGAEQRAVDGPAGKLVYWTVGEGPVVILVHGTNDQAGLWWRTVAALKSRYRVVAIDMPGHGESEPSEGPLDMKMMRDAIETIVDSVSPEEPVVLVGNSMGGWASLLYALDKPDRVRQLVLESSGGISLEEPPSVTLLPTTIEEARAAFDAALGPDGLIPDVVLEDFIRRAPTSPAARLTERSWDEYLLDDRLGELEVPTALIWGEQDGILPLSYAERMQSMIDGATLTVIPGCGHIPHNECADKFIEALNSLEERWCIGSADHRRRDSKPSPTKSTSGTKTAAIEFPWQSNLPPVLNSHPRSEGWKPSRRRRSPEARRQRSFHDLPR